METRRRRRRSIAGSRGTVAEGEVRDSIDPSDDPEEDGLEDDINAAAVAAAANTEDRVSHTPAGRMEDVRNRASEYEREYRLQLIHRLLLRRVPLDTIAAELGVSVSTVLRDRRLLFKRLREEASNLDANTMIGDTVGFYRETRAMALKAASQNKTPMNHKMQAIRTALSSQNDLHRFLHVSGVFDVLRFKPAENATESGMEELMRLTEKLLKEDDEVDMQAKKLGVSKDDIDYDDEDELMFDKSLRLL